MLAMVLIVSACSDNPAGTSADPGTEPGGSAGPADPGSSAPGATSGEPVDQGGVACWSGEAAGGTETVSFSEESSDFAIQLGGGVDIRIAGGFGIRAGGDYIKAFPEADEFGETEGGNMFRWAVGGVYSF